MLREAERDLDAATPNSAVDVAGRKLVRRGASRLLGFAWDEASPQALSTSSIGKTALCAGQALPRKG
jgi:hypothetical protein